MQGRDTAAETLLGGAEEAATRARQDAMIDDVTERRSQQVREAEAIIDDTDGIIARDTDALDDVEGSASPRRPGPRRRHQARSTACGPRPTGARRTLADWRLAADIAGSDLPLVALDAYVKAVGPHGLRTARVRHPLVGPRRASARSRAATAPTAVPASAPTAPPASPSSASPSTASNGTAVVGDTDGGELDGDPNSDRAVGPMQFIPGSWRSLGRDGNGDGRADPSNIYDAALAAAGLLCRAAGSGLDTDAGLYRGALGYNNSASYASLVVRTAKAYAAREAELIPPPPPTTTTTVAPPVTAAPVAPVAPVETVPAIPGVPVVPPGAGATLTPRSRVIDMVATGP